MNIRFNEIFEALPQNPPFVGIEKIEIIRGSPFSARIGANENLAGPSPRVLQAIREYSVNAWKYPDPDSHAVKRALSQFYDIDASKLIIGEGIDGLLGYLVRMLVSPGSPVVSSAGPYPTFAYHVRVCGGKLHEVPFAGDFEDLGALLNQVKSTDANLVYISNPNNPMGTFHGAEAMRGFIESLPETCMVCLDEAYAEYADQRALLPINYIRANLIRFRTFSKLYGLAGLRIGYGIGDAILVNLFDKVRNHFSVNRLAEAAACAAIEDRAYADASRASAASGREAIAQIARSCGLTPIASSANFVTIDCGRDGAYAEAVLQGLLDRSIFVRKPSVVPLNRCIRITVGTEREIGMVATALPTVIAALK